MTFIEEWSNQDISLYPVSGSVWSRLMTFIEEWSYQDISLYPVAGSVYSNDFYLGVV